VNTVLVTGTNGKTSTVLTIAALLHASGRPVVAWSSLGRVVGGAGPDPTARPLLPSSADIAHAIAVGRRAVGPAGALVVELSVHHLAAGAAELLEPDVVVLTSIGADHLEDLGGVAGYRRTKLRAAGAVAPGGVLVAPVSLRGLLQAATQAGTQVRLVGPGGTTRTGRPNVTGTTTSSMMELPDVGRVDIVTPGPSTALHRNRRLVVACADQLGTELRTALDVAANHPPPAGRLHVEDLGDGRTAVVDAAHNPSALGQALADARRITRGRLVAVLGAGGGRDRWKRRTMGRVADAAADVVIVTDDNPRREAPADIRSAILLGAPTALEVVGRDRAIRAAIDLLGPGDTMCVLGCGPDRWPNEAGLATHDLEVVRAHA